MDGTDKRSTSERVADLIRDVCGMHCVVRYGLASDPSDCTVHVPTTWAVRTRSIRSHVACERGVLRVDGADHVVLDAHAIPRRELAAHEHAWHVVMARRGDDGLTVVAGVVRLSVGERSPRTWTLASGLAEDTGVTALSLDEATRYRLVSVTDLARWEACQIPRYASGWYVAFSDSSHRALVEVGMGSESAMELLDR